MSVRKRVWLNSPYHNYTDKKKYILSSSEINAFKLYEEGNTHWNYGDFVNATCVSKTTVGVFNNLPNYMVLYNGDTIESRWYVLSYTFLSGEPASNYGTYNVTLIRDVIVDFKNTIKSNEFKCKRGILPRNIYSPILVQPEGLSLNKIKKAQIPIKSWDKDAGWLTIFYDATEETTINFNWDDIEANYSINDMTTEYDTFNLTAPPASTSNLYKREWTQILGTYQGTATLRPVHNHYIFHYRFTAVLTPTGISFINTSTWTTRTVSGTGTLDQSYQNIIMSAIISKFLGLDYSTERTFINSNISINNEQAYSNLRNKYDQKIIGSAGSLYLADYSESESSISTNSFVSSANKLNAKITSTTFPAAVVYGGDWMNGNYYATIQSPTLVANSNLEYCTLNEFNTSFTVIPETGSMALPINRKLDEINVACLTIPFGDNVSIKNGEITYAGMNKFVAMSIATTGWTLAGSKILDIQLLPYCPQADLNSIHSSSSESNIIDISSLESSYKSPMVVTASSETIYYGLVCDKSSMDYRYNIDLSAYSSSDLKLDSITKSMRLCSQDHKSSFEFNPTLNNGVSALSISYTLRPLTTIFRICPVFKNNALYGGNYQDSRGLIWQGGFSLSQVTDQWVEYKLQNSTYQSMFNREVNNLEITQDNARALETLNYQNTYANAQTQISAQQAKAGLGLIAGLGGAVAGAATGNPLALLGGASALVGAASAGIGIGAAKETANRNLADAQKSQQINDAARSENLAYKVDIFNLQMQAIQSKPNTLASNTDYSIINYYKAYIEFYDCSDEEKQFIDKYLTYHGMKIGQIGYIFNYLSGNMSYIEGVLLFALGLTPPITNAINSELNGGIYVQEGLFA